MKEKEKDKKSVNGHTFSPIPVVGPISCSQCAKPFASKDAYTCAGKQPALPGGTALGSPPRVPSWCAWTSRPVVSSFKRRARSSVLDAERTAVCFCREPRFLTRRSVVPEVRVSIETASWPPTQKLHSSPLSGHMCSLFILVLWGVCWPFTNTKSW